MLRVKLLDSLEVKMIQDSESEELSTVKSFEWDLIDFDQDFIRLQINYKEPSDVGSFFSKDFL